MLLPAATAATGDLLFSSDQTYTTTGNNLTAIALPAASEANAVKMANGFTLSFDLVYLSTSKTWPAIINIGESTTSSYFVDTGAPGGKADGQWECNAYGYKATPITMNDAKQSLSSDANNPSHCILTLTPAEQRIDTASGETRLYSTLSFYVDGTLVAVSDVSAASYGTASYIWLGGAPTTKMISGLRPPIPTSRCTRAPSPNLLRPRFPSLPSQASPPAAGASKPSRHIASFPAARDHSSGWRFSLPMPLRLTEAAMQEYGWRREAEERALFAPKAESEVPENRD